MAQRFSPSLLKAIRLHAGLSQSALSRRIGITNVAISAFERGAARPSPETLAAMADALGVNPAAFFSVES